jgi:hypothetical protein
VVGRIQGTLLTHQYDKARLYCISPSDSVVANQELPAPEPELVCREKELDPSVEDEIKDGFFELR